MLTLFTQYNMTKIKDFFKQFDLQEKEMEVLFYLFRSGRASIIEMIKITNLKRSSIYYILDKLQSKQLITYIQQGAHRTYSPASLQMIKKLLEKRKEQTENQFKSFDSLSPDIALLYAPAANHIKVTYYEGRSGARSLFEAMLENEKKEILHVGEVVSFEQVLGKVFLKRFVQRRIAKGITTRAIWIRSKTSPEHPADKKLMRDVRYAPDWFRAPTSVFIYSGKVSLLSGGTERFGVLIESEDYFTTMKNWFEIIWQQSLEN